MMIILENPTDQPIECTISNMTMKGPSTDVLYVGQILLYDYLDSTAVETITIEPNTQHILYDRNWAYGNLISGMFDFDFPEEIKMSIVAVNSEDTIDILDTLEYLEKDVHPRGTFDTQTINLSVNMRGVNEPVKFVVGDGADEWVTGFDAITQEEVQNKGNFGVEYNITVSASNEDVAIFLNPRGNVYRGAIQWEDTGTMYTPSNGFFPDSKRGVFLGIIESGETRTFRYMLPNGSSAPVLFGLIEKSDWNNLD